MLQGSSIYSTNSKDGMVLNNIYWHRIVDKVEKINLAKGFARFYK